MGGVQYFRCKANHGLFVTADSVQVYTGPPVVSPFSTKTFSGKSNAMDQKEWLRTASPAPPASPRLAPKMPRTHSEIAAKRTPESFIDERVLVHSTGAENGAMGVIKYIGAVDGEEGTWVGVELDNPVGKHSGELNVSCLPLGWFG